MEDDLDALIDDENEMEETYIDEDEEDMAFLAEQDLDDDEENAGGANAKSARDARFGLVRERSKPEVQRSIQINGALQISEKNSTENDDDDDGDDAEKAAAKKKRSINPTPSLTEEES